MSFDKGQYSMMGLPSRQVAQRDLPSQGRLKLRRNRGEASGESIEEKLKRLKEELAEREKQAEKPKVEAKQVATASEYDDADEIPSASSSDSEEDEKPSEQLKSKTKQPSQHDLALQKELERVKKEKQARQQAINAVANGVNPLLDKSSLQRRWDDDVIFKNQGKPTDKKEKHLVNDVLHSNGHKDFMKKFIV